MQRVEELGKGLARVIVVQAQVLDDRIEGTDRVDNRTAEESFLALAYSKKTLTKCAAASVPR